MAAGCGAAPSEPQPLTPPVVIDQPEALRDVLPPALREQHVADAFAELGMAERALDDALSPVSIAPPTSSARPTPRDAGGPKDTGPPRAHPGEPSSGCETACLALASMQRSARYVCRLAGSGDERCHEASDRVRRAESRVSGASCACPADAG